MQKSARMFALECMNSFQTFNDKGKTLLIELPPLRVYTFLESEDATYNFSFLDLGSCRRHIFSSGYGKLDAHIADNVCGFYYVSYQNC